jgi:hypothetical protein
MTIVALSDRWAHREPLLQLSQTPSYGPLATAFLDTGFLIVGPGSEFAPGSIFDELAFQETERFVQLSIDHPHDHMALLSPSRPTLASHTESIQGARLP